MNKLLLLSILMVTSNPLVSAAATTQDQTSQTSQTSIRQEINHIAPDIIARFTLEVGAHLTYKGTADPYLFCICTTKLKNQIDTILTMIQSHNLPKLQRKLIELKEQL